jgi:hypothetical protein
MEDWLAGDTLVLGLRGDLDADACQAVAERLRELAASRVGVRLTLDLSGVLAVDAEAAEDLFLQVVGVHARRAIISFAGACGTCQGLLEGLAIPATPRVSVERLGMGRYVAGVTA